MRVHMVLKNDPQMAQEVQNSPAGGAVSGALDAHIREHLAFVFRRQIEEELGTPLPPMDQPLPEDVEKNLSTLVADAADQLMGKKQQQQQAEMQAQQQQDPIIQMRQQELGIQESEVQRKQQADQAKQQLEQQKLAMDAEQHAAEQQMDAAELHLDVQELASKERLDTEKLKLEEQKLALEAEIEQVKFDAKQELEGVKVGKDIAKDEKDRNSE